MPRLGKHAARDVDGAEPERRARSCPRLRGERRHHRVQQRQRDRRAQGAAQERAARKMLLRDDHGCCTLVCATVLVVSAGSSLVRIWKGALSTMPTMIESKPVIVLRRFLYDPPNHRHVGRLEAAAQRVRQHPLVSVVTNASGRLRMASRSAIGPLTLEPSASMPADVERRAVGVRLAPLPHRIEVLERKTRGIDDAMAARAGLRSSGAIPAAPAPSLERSQLPCCFRPALGHSAAAEAAACSGRCSGRTSRETPVTSWSPPTSATGCSPGPANRGGLDPSASPAEIAGRRRPGCRSAWRAARPRRCSPRSASSRALRFSRKM